MKQIEFLDNLLAQAEKARGLPDGLLRAIRQQEIGNNTKYVDQPDAYHYPVGPNGKRVAGHTGKVSTAFGPFGLLESTAAQPGYGVTPLRDKSLEEQVRFAADYIGARIKKAGSVAAGLAGYGEGEKYAQSVLSKMGAVPEAVPVKVEPTLPAVTANAQQLAIPVSPMIASSAQISNELAQMPQPTVLGAVDPRAVKPADIDFARKRNSGPMFVPMALPDFSGFIEETTKNTSPRIKPLNWGLRK